jgi:hypothetical protein
MDKYMLKFNGCLKFIGSFEDCQQKLKEIYPDRMSQRYCRIERFDENQQPTMKHPLRGVLPTPRRSRSFSSDGDVEYYD